MSSNDLIIIPDAINNKKFSIEQFGDSTKLLKMDDSFEFLEEQFAKDYKVSLEEMNELESKGYLKREKLEAGSIHYHVSDPPKFL